MPTNRNNNELGKAFAVGTKIEYNGKSYEVIESNSCVDCSIANICSSSNISASDRNDDALSRDKRINIFGECSHVRRPDTKSVVFVEIPKNNTKDKYYKIEPLFRDDNPSKLKSVEFDLPNGYVIDKDNSDLDKGIIRFKRKGYVIPYNFPLNTRRGFRTIYYLMKLSQHDMITVIKDIIAVRHAGINFIINVCDKLEKENNCMLTSLRGG